MYSRIDMLFRILYNFYCETGICLSGTKGTEHCIRRLLHSPAEIRVYGGKHNEINLRN